MAEYLLVEDEEPFGTELLNNLADLGLSAERAIDGVAAMNLLEKKEYQGIILDLKLGRLPSPQGLQILEWVSRHKKGTAVVVVTAHAHLGFRALELGVDALLYKPVQAQHVLHYMMRAIELRRLRKENLQLRKALSLALGTHAPTVAFAILICIVVFFWRKLLPGDMIGLPLVFVIGLVALLGSRRVSRLVLSFLGQKLEINVAEDIEHKKRSPKSRPAAAVRGPSDSE